MPDQPCPCSCGGGPEPSEVDALRDGGGSSGEEGFLLLTRRRLLTLLLTLSGTAVGAAILYPVVRYLVPPEVEESTSNEVTLNISPDDLEPNSGRIFRFGSRPGLIIRTPSGEFRAFTAICTHLDCTVQYRSDISHIWCACHNGHYNLQGQPIKGPPPRDLAEYEVRVSGDEIVVSRGA